VSKTTAKPVSATKAPAKKAAAAPAAKPAPKSPAPPVSSAKTAASKTPAAKTPAKPAAKAAPAPAPKPVASKPAVAEAAPQPVKASAAKTSAAKTAPVAAPNPLPAVVSTSRFADRFAPPRPPTRQMNAVLIDTPKPEHKADPKLANAWKSKSGRDLTEPEVLAMPESEYMNDKQLEFFRAKLQALKDDLLSNAGQTTEHLREDTSIVPDPADRATIEELRTRDRERKLLKKISQSLGRIDAGDYGFCDETGEPIGLGRLIARPTATLSLEAQQRREMKQKMFGD
jgi:DnaK suppressor protein